MANNYKDIAFEATKVPSLQQDKIFKGIEKYYSVTNPESTPYDTELEAVNNLLSTVDLSQYYKFVEVFYNPTNNTDKKYGKTIMVIARKTVAVNNNILNYLLAPNTTDDDITTADDSNDIPDGTALSSIKKDLSKVKGLGLSLLTQSESSVNDETVYDIKDNFIYGEFTNNDEAITCDVLFNELKSIGEKVTDNKFDVTLIDITGTALKTTTDSSITIDDSLDIYRELIGGTELNMEDLVEEPEEDEEETEPEETIKNDMDYIM